MLNPHFNSKKMNWKFPEKGISDLEDNIFGGGGGLHHAEHAGFLTRE